MNHNIAPYQGEIDIPPRGSQNWPIDDTPAILAYLDKVNEIINALRNGCDDDVCPAMSSPRRANALSRHWQQQSQHLPLPPLLPVQLHRDRIIDKLNQLILFVNECCRTLPPMGTRTPPPRQRPGEWSPVPLVRSPPFVLPDPAASGGIIDSQWGTPGLEDALMIDSDDEFDYADYEADADQTIVNRLANPAVRLPSEALLFVGAYTLPAVGVTTLRETIQDFGEERVRTVLMRHFHYTMAEVQALFDLTLA